MEKSKQRKAWGAVAAVAAVVGGTTFVDTAAYADELDQEALAAESEIELGANQSESGEVEPETQVESQAETADELESEAAADAIEEDIYSEVAEESDIESEAFVEAVAESDAYDEDENSIDAVADEAAVFFFNEQS